MKVYVNDVPVTIFAGACVMDAVRAYYARQDQAVPNAEKLTVKDGYGHRADVDGAVRNNQRLFVCEEDAV